MHFSKNSLNTSSILLLIIFFWGQWGWGFQEKDSLSDLEEKSYKFLKQKFLEYELDTIKAFIYANAYLKKAKRENDTVKVASGYYNFTYIGTTENKKKFCDSILQIRENNSIKKYTMLSFLRLASIYYETNDYKKALTNYLIVSDLALEQNHLELYYFTKKNIGVIKSRIGEHKSALKVLRECYNYVSSNKDKILPHFYLSTLFALSDSYNRNQKLDSATIINQLGYQTSVSSEKNKFKTLFILNEGINLYSKKKYLAAKDSLQKAIPVLHIEDKGNEGMAYYYLAKSLEGLGKEKEAIEAHKMVDVLFEEVGELMPEGRGSYEALIKYYKKKGNKDKQLKYIEKLITADSVLHTNYKFLIKNIVQNYDMPRLLAAKQEIIDELEEDKQSNFLVIGGLCCMAIGAIGLGLWNYQKKKSYQTRFQVLYQELLEQKEQQEISTKDSNITIEVKESELGISQDVVNSILVGLTKFEEEKGYIQRNLTIGKLAKQLHTNAKYLSRVINEHKQKNFSSYINELRVVYGVDRLKKEAQFRKYTIQAIARECGFSSKDAFAKSFYKVYRLQPSYFIQELEKTEKN